MLVIDPGIALSEKIAATRQLFYEKYKITPLQYKPNVLLASFKQYAMAEERIISRLNTIAMGFQPFKVELKDFGSYPSHTIFINITSKIPIQNLVKKIRTETQLLMKLGEDKPFFNIEPHINIAQRLKPWQHESGWLEYSHRQFTGRFIATEMLLLKRYEGDNRWQVAKHFTFQNLPIETKQAELFA